MKKTIQIFAMVAIFMGATLNSTAQTPPDWNTDGNEINGGEWFGADENSDIPVSFEHRANDPASRFEWYTTDGTLQERMRLTRAGWLGINIDNPLMRFHVLNGGILSTGTIGTNPNIGAGTRLMWIPDQGAFRAGIVNGTQWDGGNVGDASVAFGSNNLVSGDNSAAFASGSTVSGNSSISFGDGNTLSGGNTVGIGSNHTISGDQGVAIGARSTVNGEFGLTLGQNLQSDATNSVVIGRGVDVTNPLINNIASSLMVGFNSTLSTVFVGPPEGVEEFGSVGIGDVTEPTERLDVRGTARFRVMEESASPDVVITGMEADEEGDFVLHYSNINNVGECTWDKVNGDQDLATGYTDACVQGSVLIGTDQPQNSKLYVVDDQVTTMAVRSVGTNSTQIGGLFEAQGGVSSSNGLMSLAFGSPLNIGVVGAVTNEATHNTGVRGSARLGNYNYGLVGFASMGQVFNYGCYSSSDSPSGLAGFGTYSKATGTGIDYNVGGYFYACDAEKNIGVYAEVCDTSSAMAGYFVGNVLTSQTPITFSDESLKLELNEIESALETINQLQPMQFYYNTTDYPYLQLDKSLSYGFSAQQLQEILPEMVKEVHHPAKYDSTGVLITPGLDVLGVQYQELIPILTAGVKEQQAQIQSQDDQIAGLMETMMQMQEQMQMMQEQINGCCQGDITPKNSGMGQENSPSEKSFGQNELYQNVPNPFRSQTTISYTLEQGGKVLLSIFDKTGKPIDTLVEAEQAADTYRYEWDASGLPAGLYHYALYVDGELLVKKAIKLAD